MFMTTPQPSQPMGPFIALLVLLENCFKKFTSYFLYQQKKCYWNYNDFFHWKLINFYKITQKNHIWPSTCPFTSHGEFPNGHPIYFFHIINFHIFGSLTQRPINHQHSFEWHFAKMQKNKEIIMNFFSKKN
jgi:hypothetical protein